MSFRAILSSLLAHASTPVRAAVFCDEEGERVEAVSGDPSVDEYEVDLAGASYAAIAGMMATAGLGGPGLGALRMRVLHERHVVWLQGVAEGYYLLVVTARNGREGTLEPLLEEAREALLEHM